MASPAGKTLEGAGAVRPGDDGSRPAESGEGNASATDQPEGDAGDSTNVWPNAAAEEIFLTEAGNQKGSAAAAPHATDAIEEIDAKGLPPLDELVKRIPAEVREALDDLFRVKYTTVRRVPKKSLKE